MARSDPRPPEAGGFRPLPAAPHPSGETASGEAAGPAALDDPITAMAPRIGGLAAAFANRYFKGFDLDPADVERLRTLDQKGAVVYVMRYASRLDYLLFNWLFLRRRVRLSGFANGIVYFYYRPVREVLGGLVYAAARRLRLGRRDVRASGLARAHHIVELGGSLFLFLRTDPFATRIKPRRGAVAALASEHDYLREVVAASFDAATPISLVPLALFWRKGGSPQRRRFIDVVYGAPDRPSATWKVLSFLFSYRNLAVRVGREIDLSSFAADHREEGVDRVLRRVRRSLLIFLRREEKPVLGAALRSRAQIEQAVMEDPRVRGAIEAAARGADTPADRLEERARKMLREIASHPNRTVLALLDLLVDWIFRRLFVRIEISGLERTIEASKLHPLVLIPNHRSHFDYLILSWLFYERHLAPPLVAAGANLAFFPLGQIFRRAGAFFLRRSFDGDQLYIAVFRSYIQQLLKDGATQEFFIEGTRSRTGKTLPPRTGLLSMLIESFQAGARRDLFIVPVSFTYEKLVEETTMASEKRGAKKTAESVGALVRAGWRLLRRQLPGGVDVCFGEPISLAGALGEAGIDPETGDLRQISTELGTDICRTLNALVTACRSSVAATAILAQSARGVRVNAFRERVTAIVRICELLGQPISENLRMSVAQGRPEAAAELLLQGGVIERTRGRDDDILAFDETARERLAYYRATIAPALAWPAVLALVVRSQPSCTREAVLADAAAWLDLLRIEFFPPDRCETALRLGRIFDHFEKEGYLERVDGRVHSSRAGDTWLGFFAGQLGPMLETYRVFFSVAAAIEAATPRKTLMSQAQGALEEQVLLGEVRHSEAVCPTTLGNALQLALAERYLAADGNPRLADTRFTRGERFAELTRLEHRVVTALSSV